MVLESTASGKVKGTTGFTSFGTHIFEALGPAGDEGWELVHVHQANRIGAGISYFYFKRPKAE